MHKKELIASHAIYPRIKVQSDAHLKHRFATDPKKGISLSGTRNCQFLLGFWQLQKSPQHEGMARKWGLRDDQLPVLSPMSSSGGGLFGRPATRKSPGRFLFAQPICATHLVSPKTFPRCLVESRKCISPSSLIP
jgi:hypothetical protein